MKTKDNYVLITGGTSGIGLSLAKKFYTNRNQVIVLGRNNEKLKDIKKEYSEMETIQADLSDLKELKNIVKLYPEINILINNAGIQENYKFSDNTIPLENLTNEITVNLTAPLLLTKLYLPLLIKQPQSAIINVSSGLAIMPKESAPVYCALKSAMHNFSISLRWQLENTSVKLFEIIPPLVDTNMTKGRGKRKLSPETLVQEFWRNFANDNYEMRIGKVKLLYFINKLAPTIAEKIIRKG